MAAAGSPAVGQASPTPDPQARGPSMRTVSLTKDEFDKQVGAGLWRISITARAGGSAAGAAAPLVSPGSKAGIRSPLSPQLRADPPRSCLGLPVISCRSRGYSLWSLVILLLDLTYSAFLLPLSIGFQVNDLEWTWACFVDLVAGAFFAAELLLGFHISFLASNQGQQREVKGGRAVARYYVRYGSFWQDALSTAIWFTQIVLLIVHQAGGVAINESSNVFQIVRIVRMIRFFSVLRHMCVLTIGSGSGALIPGLRLGPRLAHSLNITYASLVVLNFVACLWNFIAIKEGFSNTWLNPVAALVRRYSGDGASVLTSAELAGVPAPERYILGVYFGMVTMATLGYGDIVPTNPLEWAVDCVIVGLGVLMFGLALGSLAELVASSSKEARQAQLYREKMEGVNAWLHASNIPRPLKHRIRAFYSDVWLRHAARTNVVEQFQELPHALRQEVAWEQNRRLLARLPLFGELDETQRFALARMLLPVDLTPGQELCLHGDPADRFWLLHDGEVQVFDECAIVGSISAPAVLGVEALLQHVDIACAARPHGFRTATACTMWEARLEDLMPYLLENVAVLDSLCSKAHEQRESTGWLGRGGGSVGVQLGAAGSQDGGADGMAGATDGAGGTGAEIQHREAAQEQVQAAHRLPVLPDGYQGRSPFTGISTWSVSTDAISPETSLNLGWPAEQHQAQAGLPGPSPLQQGQVCHEVTPKPSEASSGAGQGQEPAVDAASFLPAARATDACEPATRSEVHALRQEVVHKLDALGAEMRQAVAAATLAQSVAALSARTHSVQGGGAGRAALRRMDSRGGMRRRQWSYGHISPA